MEVRKAAVPKESVNTAVFSEKFFKFKKINSCRDDEHEKSAPLHQLFGFPSPIQNPDMELECQLAVNGIYCGDPSGYRDPRTKELEKHKLDWILLLQLDTDDDSGMMWGDAGRLYFWIKKEDLKNSNFDNVWMILQCG